MTSEQEVVVERGEVSLAGALSLPEGADPCAVVLCLHGTGPMDRDENMPGQSADIFNTIANHLAANGVATLRYDKRGCGQSTGDYLTAGQTEFLADAQACFAHLETDERFTQIFVLGHSEGTLLAARLAGANRPDGLILLSPFAQNIESILEAQAREMEKAMRAAAGLEGLLNRLMIWIAGSPIRNQRKLIDRLKNGNEKTFRMRSQPVPAKSLRELMAIEPLSVYAEVRCPALVLGGAKDIQCDPADVGRIAEVLGELADPVVVPDLTHILRRDEGEHDFRSYAALISQPMDAEVLSTVSSWLKARSLSG